MKRYFWSMLVSVVVVGVWVVGCPSMAGSKNAASIAKQSVTSVLTAQCDAWNRGDLDGFMTGYLNSPDTSYTSGGTEVWGYDALRDRYQHRYGSNRESMGKLSFSDIKVFDLGKSNALCLGHWHLERASQDPLDGVYSLVLVKTSGNWKIMHDHTSTIEKKHES